VEAATAGEAGKGFAVVAQEVRTLAGKSAEAAKEIKSLVSSASNKAYSGKEIAAEMIDGYTTLNESISKNMKLIKDIEDASKEQQNSIIQVNKVVTSLDEVTHQNAEEAKNINSITTRITSLASKLMVISKNTIFIDKASSQICDVELTHITSKLKNDHIKFKEMNYAELGNNKHWIVANYHECNLGKWIDESDKEEKFFTKTKNWDILKDKHKKIHDNLQNYIDNDAKNSPNKQLNKIATDIEESILGIFDNLDAIKIENCTK